MRKDRLIADVLGDEAALTPSDLYHADFKRSSVGGYDRKEVDAFLSRAGDVFESLLVQLRHAREDAEQLRNQLAHVHDMEQSLHQALHDANQVQQRMSEAAQREADALIEQARATQQRMYAEASELPAALRTEIEGLRATRERLRAELRAVIATHSALLVEITPAERRPDRNAAPAEAGASKAGKDAAGVAQMEIEGEP